MYVISKVILPTSEQDMWAVQIDHCFGWPGEEEQWVVINSKTNHECVIKVYGDTNEQAIRRALITIEALNRDERERGDFHRSERDSGFC